MNMTTPFQYIEWTITRTVMKRPLTSKVISAKT
jgi:hypothetical protein